MSLRVHHHSNGDVSADVDGSNELSSSLLNIRTEGPAQSDKEAEAHRKESEEEG